MHRAARRIRLTRPHPAGHQQPVPSALEPSSCRVSYAISLARSPSERSNSPRPPNWTEHERPLRAAHLWPIRAARWLPPAPQRADQPCEFLVFTPSSSPGPPRRSSVCLSAAASLPQEARAPTSLPLVALNQQARPSLLDQASHQDPEGLLRRSSLSPPRTPECVGRPLPASVANTLGSPETTSASGLFAGARLLYSENGFCMSFARGYLIPPNRL